MSRSAEVNAPHDAARDLLDAARGGSVEDFGTLIAGLRDYLLLVANRELTPNVRAKISASDVVQETFIQAQRKIAAFEGGTTGELLACLRGILLTKIQVAEQRYIGVQARDVRREVELDARAHRPVANQRYSINGNRPVDTRSSRSGQPPLTKCWGACRANTSECCGCAIGSNSRSMKSPSR